MQQDPPDDLGDQHPADIAEAFNKLTLEEVVQIFPSACQSVAQSKFSTSRN